MVVTSSLTVSPPQSITALLGELIYQHLLQEGHTETAAAVNRDLLGGVHEVIDHPMPCWFSDAE